jgi:hypothetical protein
MPAPINPTDGSGLTPSRPRTQAGTRPPDPVVTQPTAVTGPPLTVPAAFVQIAAPQVAGTDVEPRKHPLQFERKLLRRRH